MLKDEFIRELATRTKNSDKCHIASKYETSII